MVFVVETIKMFCDGFNVFFSVGHKCHTSPGTRNEGDKEILKYKLFYFHNQTEEHMETSHMTFNNRQQTWGRTHDK